MMRPGPILPTLLVASLAGLAADLSAQPTCPAPFPWRIEAVDERFGITRQDAADAVRQAGMLWASAIGNPLLFPESPEGVPIRFVFDERQERVVALRGQRAELDARARAIESGRAEARRLGEETQRQREILRILMQDFESRQRAHVELVESWNGRGGAPRAEVERLDQISAALDRERESLDTRTATLNAQVARLNEDTERWNTESVALAAEQERLASAFGEIPGQPAAFQDSRRTFGPFILSRTRGIDIFRFEDTQALALVLARQLGYGLGLETSEVPGAIMSMSPRRATGAESLALDPADIDALRALCPDR